MPILCPQPIPSLQTPRSSSSARPTSPFWQHPGLVPLESSCADTPTCTTVTTAEKDNPLSSQPVDDDEGGEREASDDEGADDDIVDTRTGDWATDRGQTFRERLLDDIATIRAFADGLEHQEQFGDWRMLEELEHTGARFLRMARTCLSRERRMNTTRRSSPTTWERGASSATEPGHATS